MSTDGPRRLLIARAELVGREREIEHLERLLAPDAEAGAHGAVLLRGEAGIGKTRLAAAAAAAAGDGVVQIRATAALVRSPFGALRRGLLALGCDDQGDGPTLAARLAAEVRARAGVVIVVDDVPALDPASRAALVALVISRELPVIFTARSGHRLPPDVEALVDDGWMHPVTLGPLEADASHQLAEQLLGGALEPDAARQLHAESAGHPLLLSELLEEALDNGSCRESASGWVITRLAPSGRLVTMLARRLDALTPQARTLAEVIAAGQPLPLHGARGRGPALAELAASGLLLEEPDGDGLSCGRLSHPLYDDVLRHRADERRWRKATQVAAGALLAAPESPLAPERRLRAVTLLVEVGLEAGLDETLDAARRAVRLGDAALALRLADNALARAPSDPRAQLIRGSALSTLHDAAARTALELAVTTATSTADVISAVQRLAAHVATVEGAPAEAVAIVRDGIARLQATDGARALDADLMRWQLSAGLPVDVPHATGADGDVLARIGGLRHTAHVGMLEGRIAEAHAALDEAFTLAPRVEHLVPYSEPLLQTLRFLTLMTEGRLDEAEQGVIRRRDRDAGGDPTWSGLWYYLLSLAALYGGRASEADRLAAAASRAVAWRDLAGLTGLVRVLRADALAQQGRVSEATGLLDEVPAETLADPRGLLRVAETRAWMLLARRRHDEAAIGLAEAAAQTVELGSLSYAIVTAYHAVRFGRADLVADLIDDLGARLEGPLAATVRAATAAVVAEDGPELAACGERFAAMGFLPLAADALAQAARILGTRDGAPLRRRALEIADAIDGALVGAGERQRLSERELEIARLAAAGERSIEIAGRLGLSPRTVDNHLLRSYRKLGIGGRRELASALGTLSETSAR